MKAREAQKTRGEYDFNGNPIPPHKEEQPPPGVGVPDPDKPHAVLVPLSEVKAEPVSWLWRLWIPRRALTLLDGDPDLGKSTITLDTAARVSRGWAMPPGGGAATKPGKVLILSAEDDPRTTIRPRLEAAGADLKRVIIIPCIKVGAEELPVILPEHLALLEQAVQRVKPELVIIDPVMSYVGTKVDAHKDQHVRALLLHPLKIIAEKAGASILGVRHLNKSNGGPALYRGGGSIGILGAARSGMLVGKHPQQDGVYVLASVKHNLGPAPKALTYRLEPHGDVAVIRWGGECDLAPDDIINQQQRHNANALQNAAKWLAKQLAAGPIEVQQIQEHAEAEGVSPRTLRRAKEKLGVKAQPPDKLGGPWRWVLPGADAKSCPRPSPNGQDLRDPCNSSNLASVGQNHLNGQDLSDPPSPKKSFEGFSKKDGGPYAKGIRKPTTAS